MPVQYFTSMKDVDKQRVLLLIDASLQAYNAFDEHEPASCQTAKIVAPTGFEFTDSWTGVDAIFGADRTLECYGVVFRSIEAPYTYVFAFRGTDSILDILDDLGAISTHLKAYDTNVAVPSSVGVESGFHDVYSLKDKNAPSMQTQLFQLVDRYQASDKPIHQLLITGHSLGAALSEVFTLDLALSRPSIIALNINYACPRVGNSDFVNLYEQQPAQCNPGTRTLRVQNSYDKVPCVPPEELGYQHLSTSYLVAFYREGLLHEFNLLDRHSSQNYRAVLKCAAGSNEGMCINDKLPVPENGYNVTSEQPDPKKVCSF